MRRIVLVLLSTIATALAAVTAADASQQGAAQMKWRVVPTVTGTIIPNYQSGFGPQGGTGSGQTPAVGGSATLGGGYVDFGTLVAGYQYLYKYAAQVQVTTNDNSGFKVFAEGSTDFKGTMGSTQSMRSILFWVQSGSGNTPFTPGTPFLSTTNTGDTSLNGGNNLGWAGVGPPASTLVWSYATAGSSSEGFDYEVNVPESIATDTFTATVVYTVVGN